jgi:hypothetical protein
MWAHGFDLSLDVGAFKNVVVAHRLTPWWGSLDWPVWSDSRVGLVSSRIRSTRGSPGATAWCFAFGLGASPSGYGVAWAVGRSRRYLHRRHLHRCGEDGGATISVTLAPNPHAVTWAPPAVVSFCDDRRFPQSHRFLTIARRHGEKAATAVQAQIR